jgi:hypothetical protein
VVAALCCGRAPAQRSAHGEGVRSRQEQISLAISACCSPPPLALASSWPAPATHCTAMSSPRSASTPFPPSDPEAADGRTQRRGGRAVAVARKGRRGTARQDGWTGSRCRGHDEARRMEAQIAKIGHVRVGELGFAQQEGERKARANEPGGCLSAASVQGPGETPRYLWSKTRRSTWRRVSSKSSQAPCPGPDPSDPPWRGPIRHGQGWSCWIRRGRGWILWIRRRGEAVGSGH